MPTPNPLMYNIVDDFGNECNPFWLSIEAMNLFIRFILDGMIEGIADGQLSGNADADAMRFFGLIQ